MNRRRIMFEKKYIVILTCFVAIMYFGLAFYLRHCNLEKYSRANKYMVEKSYSEAAEIFEELGDFKNSENLAKEAREKEEEQKKEEAKVAEIQRVCDEATAYYEEGNIEDAVNKLSSIEGNDKSEKLLKEYKFTLAEEYFEQGKYEAAGKIFDELKGDATYKKDSSVYLARINVKNEKPSKQIVYEEACENLDNGKYEEALEKFNELLGYSDSEQQAEKCKRKIEKEQRAELSHTIAAGVEHVLAVTADGKVMSVGEDSYGECTGVRRWENIISVDCYGEVSVGLCSDGTVKVAGNLNKEEKRKVSKWKNVVDVAVGEKYVVALKRNCKVVSQGHNGDGQCNVTGWEDIVDIDAGWRMTVGLTKKGELRFVGNIPRKLLTDYSATKSEWKDVVEIAVSGGDPSKGRGTGHVVGLKTDGTVIAIGDDLEGQCKTKGKKWKKIVGIAAGDWYTVGLKKNGKVLITGENNPAGLLHTKYIDLEKLNAWTNVKDIAAGYGMTVVQNGTGKLDIMGFTDVQDGDRDALNEVTMWRNIRQKE